MSAAVIGWAALGGAVGSALRYSVDVAVTRRWRGAFPLATFLINVSGSLLLGLVLGLLAVNSTVGHSSAAGPGVAATLVGTGVLGGYTTFSTASFDAVRLAREGRRLMAVTYAVGTMLVAVAAALLGLWLGAWWTTVV
ncbi:fluoride efflux transporter FluC [Dietzia cercidiphylli]|uniref:Fluoride-specific ion channel FluC n=1 Tax=Dietzia cercidiphylli TaxID=498199 RepID=A0ABP4UUK0_9ACTN|nr:CrcB family protein [Dietzia cercidiphylli]MBB1046848.1 CrcB family protein [Dietzia cercidiphylli]